MVTVDDIAAVIKTRLGAAAEVAAAIPGGSFFGRGPDEPAAAYPYLVFQVQPGEAMVYSGGAYQQAFVVAFAAYCPVGDTGVSPGAVSSALAACFTTTAGQAATAAVALRNATERVLHCRPLKPTGVYAQELREGRDVFAAGLEFELLVQGDRAVA